MDNNELIVFGSTSSIAKFLLPNLEIDSDRIISFDRQTANQQINDYIPEANQYHLEWDNALEIELFVLKILRERLSKPVLVLNFMGYFGRIERIEELDIEESLLTNSKNLLPFLLVAKIGRALPVGSQIISFSGAGIGGDNLDDSSLGYLAAKASMAVLSESIDLQLAEFGVRFGLIAPGAFPSRMQEIVAQEDSTRIPQARIAHAKKIMSSIPSTDKLVRLIIFLADNPNLLGGRTWSANFDEITEHQGNFGRLRRII